MPAWIASPPLTCVMRVAVWEMLENGEVCSIIVGEAVSLFVPSRPIRRLYFRQRCGRDPAKTSSLPRGRAGRAARGVGRGRSATVILRSELRRAHYLVPNLWMVAASKTNSMSCRRILSLRIVSSLVSQGGHNHLLSDTDGCVGSAAAVAGGEEAWEKDNREFARRVQTMSVDHLPRDNGTRAGISFIFSTSSVSARRRCLIEGADAGTAAVASKDPGRGSTMAVPDVRSPGCSRSGEFRPCPMPLLSRDVDLRWSTWLQYCRNHPERGGVTRVSSGSRLNSGQRLSPALKGRPSLESFMLTGYRRKKNCHIRVSQHDKRRGGTVNTVAD